MYDVVSIGEPVIDFVPLQTGDCLTYQAFPGGGAANVLAQVCAMGGTSFLSGAVGDDLFGDFLLREVASRGIDIGGIGRTRAKNTGISFVQLTQQGERSFLNYRDYETDPGLWGPPGEAALDQCRIFHFTSVSLVGSAQREATLKAARAAADRGRLLSFDVNYRDTMWQDKGLAKELILQSIDRAQIIKLSEEEQAFLCPGADSRECARRLDRTGKKLVLISLGAQGSFFSFEKGQGLCPGFPVRAKDTTGCGDAFVGTVLASLAKVLGLQGLAGVPLDAMERIVTLGNAAGALCATRYGSLSAMPSRREVLDFLDSRR